MSLELNIFLNQLENKKHFTIIYLKLEMKMKKLKFVTLMIAALFMGFGFTSCEKDSILTEDEDETPSEWELVVEENGTGNVTVFVSDLEEGATEVDVTVKFTSNDGNMRRLYLTQNIAGAGAEKFELDIPGLSKKGDGSLDLSKNEKKEFNFKIPFPVLPEMKVGTVVYKLWATSGSGDYRNMDKRWIAGPGTITVDYGGSNPANAKVKEYTAKLLAAPTADGKSETFISLVDGELYKINQGEEMVYYWDFGYFYGATSKASLSSTFDYPSNIINIPSIANLENKDELNHCNFALSTMDFDAVINASDLNDIQKPANETIKQLSKNDVVEFVDNYGKKGLIKVVDIKGTDGAKDYIELNIKVQP